MGPTWANFLTTLPKYMPRSSNNRDEDITERQIRRGSDSPPHHHPHLKKKKRSKGAKRVVFLGEGFIYQRERKNSQHCEMRCSLMTASVILGTTVLHLLASLLCLTHTPILSSSVLLVFIHCILTKGIFGCCGSLWFGLEWYPSLETTWKRNIGPTWGVVHGDGFIYLEIWRERFQETCGREKRWSFIRGFSVVHSLDWDLISQD